MAQLKVETCTAVAEQAVTKVHGQPTNTDIDLLEEELIAIAATAMTALGGGNNEHARMLLAMQNMRPSHQELPTCSQQTLAFTQMVSPMQIGPGLRWSTKSKSDSLKHILAWRWGKRISFKMRLTMIIC